MAPMPPATPRTRASSPALKMTFKVPSAIQTPCIARPVVHTARTAPAAVQEPLSASRALQRVRTERHAVQRARTTRRPVNRARMPPSLQGPPAAAPTITRPRTAPLAVNTAYTVPPAIHRARSALPAVQTARTAQTAFHSERTEPPALQTACTTLLALQSLRADPRRGRHQLQTGHRPRSETCRAYLKRGTTRWPRAQQRQGHQQLQTGHRPRPETCRAHLKRGTTRWPHAEPLREGHAGLWPGLGQDGVVQSQVLAAALAGHLLVLGPAETGESEATPPPAACGVLHGEKQLVLPLLLLHHTAQIEDAFVLDVFSAQAVQLQREFPVAEQPGHVHGHGHGLLVLPQPGAAVARHAPPTRLV
ncbi:hypothetical protein E2C01_009308 [Portunus trituberculatus]|uniref:Uncharacterized protein n=1 Tax=Portunus trituberculatus TaxID=210409 RepID=A0A5B7D5F3_PORTR|nr:hypothetical protein [Portunus trituberculatus]